MRFTPDEAFEAKEAGEPIMIDRDTARQIVAQHQVSQDEFFTDCGRKDQYDAAEVLGWLGY